MVLRSASKTTFQWYVWLHLAMQCGIRDWTGVSCVYGITTNPILSLWFLVNCLETVFHWLFLLFLLCTINFCFTDYSFKPLTLSLFLLFSSRCNVNSHFCFYMCRHLSTPLLEMISIHSINLALYFYFHIVMEFFLCLHTNGYSIACCLITTYGQLLMFYPQVYSLILILLKSNDI